mgnify:CR=1 FL=1
MAGMGFTAGSLVFRQRVALRASLHVARLRSAGAIIVGKTNTPEFNLLGETHNRLGPDTCNPWDTNRSSGGSSGGTAALPLVARDPTQLLSFAPTNTPAPQMAVIVAAQAEDVQQWLQIVQPVNRLPVVAITAAGAEPVLQPYLASGQLAGLVSGFDGGAAYQALRAEPLSQQAQRKQMLAVGVQNSGAIALLFIILAGNMARLFRRERRG